MRKLYLPLFISIVCLFACTQKKEAKPATSQPGSPSRNRPVQADAYIVKGRSISEDIQVAGSLAPAEGTDVRPEISGRVVNINFQEGSSVQKGTLLVKLFDADLQAQLKKLEIELAINQKTLERYNELLKIQGISQQDVDLSQLQVNNNKADIELVKVNIGKTEIRAPYNGRIGLRNVSLGAYVSPSDIIATIRQVDQLKLEFTVPEKYSNVFKSGKQISFTVEGADKKFLSTVIATEYFIDANTRSLTVKGIVKERNPALVPGAFAKVGLDLDKEDKAIIIPTQAVIPLSRGKQAIVYKGGTPNFVPITTGIRDSAYVQVLTGINIGDTVLISGLMAVKPNSQVQLSNIK
ncbi:MAG: efflux RND transporter periplasmic adaptor subunit [Chitinophagaceae bacterium]|jgi:membrane fusion protein (multidrug efflux system)|nr:efflux RND transporter periplasmic adaptor subunit [Chitinophagaceae bacterium]